MASALPLPSRHLYSDEEWLELMIHGLEVGRPDLPSGPSDEIQMRFVGASGAAALRGCFGFVQHVKAAVDQENLAGPLLDFGVGWGRVLRLFAHETDVEMLYGVDVDADILAICEATRVPGRLLHIEPGEELPFVDEAFRFAYSYSVFSHLSEEAAQAALAELGRVVGRGGQLAITVQGRRFLDLCCAIRDKRAREELRPEEASIDAFFADPAAARERFLRGEHAYTGVGGGDQGPLTGDFYGWAAMPPAWLERHAPAFELTSVIVDPDFEQDIIVLRRR